MQNRSRLAVLVVEDEPLISMLVTDMVVELGHELAGEVSTAAAALDTIKAQPPDLVLLDINLSGDLSYEVANHCTIAGIPVVLTTGYQAADIPEGLSHCPVLTKPFSVEALAGAIERALAAGK